jgi:predicted methyltransferase
MADKWMICPVCRGEGQYVNPSIDANGITAEEMHELGDDFREEYTAGAYDVTCQICQGTGKVLSSEWAEEQERLAQAASDRRLAAREDGDFEAYSGAGDWRWGA